jgi:hypothetical protein
MTGRVFCWLALLTWTAAAAAQTTSPPADIQQVQQLAELMVRLCVGGGQTQVVTGMATGGADISLRSLDVKGNLAGEFKISKSTAEGLVNGIDSALTQVAADQADKVRSCLQPVRDRILNILLPASNISTSKQSIPLQDNEVSGRLQAANDRTPPNGCDTAPISGDAMTVLIGNNAVAKNGFGKFIPLKIGKCEVLWLERTPQGVFANADFFDGADNPARIRNNEIVALNGENYTARQTRDLSTLIVRDRQGQELLYVRFINPNTVRVRGVFGCAGHRPVLVRDDQPIPGVFMSNSCFIGDGVAISIQ